jgi:hypothetical protein
MWPLITPQFPGRSGKQFMDGPVPHAFNRIRIHGLSFEAGRALDNPNETASLSLGLLKAKFLGIGFGS